MAENSWNLRNHENMNQEKVNEEIELLKTEIKRLGDAQADGTHKVTFGKVNRCDVDKEVTFNSCLMTTKLQMFLRH